MGEESLMQCANRFLSFKSIQIASQVGQTSTAQSSNIVETSGFWQSKQATVEALPFAHAMKSQSNGSSFIQRRKARAGIQTP